MVQERRETDFKVRNCERASREILQLAMRSPYVVIIRIPIKDLFPAALNNVIELKRYTEKWAISSPSIYKGTCVSTYIYFSVKKKLFEINFWGIISLFFSGSRQ